MYDYVIWPTFDMINKLANRSSIHISRDTTSEQVQFRKIYKYTKIFDFILVPRIVPYVLLFFSDYKLSTCCAR